MVLVEYDSDCELRRFCGDAAYGCLCDCCKAEVALEVGEGSVVFDDDGGLFVFGRDVVVDATSDGGGCVEG